MQKNVYLPQVELNMERVEVVRWLVGLGELVQVDQALLEVETQKAAIEVPSLDAGYVRLKCVEEGDEIGEGSMLCILTDEAAESFEPPGAAVSPDPPASKSESEPDALPGSRAATSGRDFKGIVPASPAARRLAKERGIDLHAVPGTGPGGRVTEADVRSLEAVSVTAADGEQWTPIALRRRALNQKMEESLQQIPQFHLRREMDVSALMVRQPGTTFTHRLVRCVAAALKEHPALRTSIAGDRTRERPVDVAVAMQSPDGLVAPVLRHVDRSSLSEIAETAKELERRIGKLEREELADAPFAISNLGMFNVDSFDAFLFHGQTAVLAIGRARGGDDRATVASFSLALDHRLVDGVEGARFLETLQARINGFAVSRTSK